ncbi:MAG: hypothetical protein E6R08_00360 [Nevskiaceae bacterium]|nr:MAG: hypothetical protein E6R08_00360 [Nevskiaceae bacterium]
MAVVIEMAATRAQKDAWITAVANDLVGAGLMAEEALEFAIQAAGHAWTNKLPTDAAAETLRAIGWSGGLCEE